MSDKKEQKKVNWFEENPLIASILVAAVIIAASLVFLGIRLGNGGSDSQKSFAEQLAEYEVAQQEVQIAAQAEQEKLAAAQAKNVEPITKGDHILGNPDAEITIFEYSDFECPYCKRFYETPGGVVANSDGKVNSVFRHFPLSFHDPLATTEALASECAADIGGNDKFWEYHDEIFARTNSNGNGLEKSELYVIAKDLGLNAASFKSCLDSKKFADDVRADMASGSRAGVTGTPGNIIRNNKTGEVKFLPGAYPIENIQAAIDDLLK